MILRSIVILGITAVCSLGINAQQQQKSYPQPKVAANTHSFDKMDKRLDDILWHEKLNDVAYISKVRIASAPRAVRKKTGTEFLDSLLDNQLIIYAYVFIPKTTEQDKKYPVIVFPHGGVHGSFSTVYAPFMRELMAQGYLIIAPDYRGSTGYGKKLYEAIDYGGLENDDARACARYMTEYFDIADANRVGIMGWSHGGMITLMEATQHPEIYKCGYAGVPVSDVAYRLQYQKPSYKDEFSADYHIGKLPADDPAEYARRSPVTHASKLQIPLMITTTKNDDDVSWTEVNHMIEALKAAGKDFEYKIYEPMPGAHIFERIDTPEALEVRFNAHQFMAKHLQPPHPFSSIKEMRKAGYFFH